VYLTWIDDKFVFVWIAKNETYIGGESNKHTFIKPEPE